MKKKFGRFIRHESGEIQVSLEEVQGQTYLDLRIYNRAAHHDENSRPEQIAVPLRMLGDLCEILHQTKEDLVKEALIEAPSPDEARSTEAHKPVFVLRAEEPRRQSEMSAPLTLPAECRLLSAPKSSPTKPTTEQVTGHTRDLSPGGAQIWLPEQFPIGCHLAVFMRTGELTFRAQAEVKGVASNPEHGYYRHNLKWMVLDPQARTALAQIIEIAPQAATPRG